MKKMFCPLTQVPEVQSDAFDVYFADVEAHRGGDFARVDAPVVFGELGLGRL